MTGCAALRSAIATRIRPPRPPTRGLTFILANEDDGALMSTFKKNEFFFVWATNLSYRLIGKLTAFLQLQEFSQRNQTWELRTSTFAARLFLLCSNLGLEIS